MSETSTVTEDASQLSDSAPASASVAAPVEQPLGLWQLIKEDIQFNQGLSRPGARAMIAYRFGAWAETVRIKVVGRVLRRVALSMHRYVRNSYGIELYPTATIGRRFVIGHQGAIVIHQFARIGNDCLIRQGVTMGIARLGTGALPENAPTLGDRVDVGAGAIIMGGLTLGDDVRIFPNAVVMSNVAAGSTVISPISRVIPRS